MRDLADTGPDNRNCKFLCGVVEGFYGRPWTSEQRKRLFKWMKKMGMNTYLYAPKDDSKHRVFWREQYSVEEADALTVLIEAAEAQGISFVYAISPGLDITYSGSKDIQLLKKKLQQVMSFGCSAFALLFDDIDIEMCEADKEIFSSFAQAQVSVSNEVFQHLHQPAKFLFCPTEYCASRAVPNVSSSEYLNTIGSKLLPGVDILWTGPKVISKYISVQSIEELSSVLKRPPVIWDNLHANDYDQKRLFLGPYDGRSTDLIPYLRGVLTNPNCEFEANFIALHTLGQWYQSNVDGTKREPLLGDNPLTADIRLETESDYGSDEESQLFLQSLYKPRQALTTAISDWMEEIHNNTGTKRLFGDELPPPPLGLQVTAAPTPGVNTCMAPTMTTNTPSELAPVPAVSITNPVVSNLNELVRAEIVVNDSYLQLPGETTHNSLVDSGTDTDEESVQQSTVEPMDCLVTPGSTPASTSCMPPPLVTVQTTNHPLTEDCVSDCGKSIVSSNCDSMQVDSVIIPSCSSVEEPQSCCRPRSQEEVLRGIETPVSERCLLTQEDIIVLVELFYMPFQYGSIGVKLLREFTWLKLNCPAIAEGKKTGDNELMGCVEWRERAQKFRELVATIGKVMQRLCNSPNQGLIYDMYPYVWDIWTTASLLGSFVEWLGANPLYRRAFTKGESEPWVFRGGLQGELQRLLPLETAMDLLQTVVPPTPTPRMMRVRPFMPQDEAVVYDICRKTFNESCDASDKVVNYPDLPGDRFVGALLTVSQEYCFVIEGEEGVCGYVCSALDSADLHEKMVAWTVRMRDKYPKPDALTSCTGAERELISSLHEEVALVRHCVYVHHPSVMALAVLKEHRDHQCVRHALALCLAALTSNGSCGVHTHVLRHNKDDVELHAKLGFFDIPATAANPAPSVPSECPPGGSASPPSPGASVPPADGSLALMGRVIVARVLTA